MKTFLLALVGLGFLGQTPASWASHDCEEAVADWKPRKILRQRLEARGWQVERIKVDDGCYEVEGRDPYGNRIEADYTPASLRLRKLEIEFADGAQIPGGLYSESPARGDDSPETSSSPATPN